MRGWTALLVVVLATTLARPALCDGACFPPAVGEAISARMESHDVDRAMPAGWTLDGVNVWPERIELHVLDPRGSPVLVQLRPTGKGAPAADGHGRWASFVITPPVSSGRDGLLRVAAVVEDAV
ncbi:MAG: hypothetical protein ACRENE_14255, partial [Polyangiaceae bacterium]